MFPLKVAKLVRYKMGWEREADGFQVHGRASNGIAFRFLDIFYNFIEFLKFMNPLAPGKHR